MNEYDQFLEQHQKPALLLSDIDIDDTNWYQAKEIMRESFKGREVLEWAENYLDVKCNNYFFGMIV